MLEGEPFVSCVRDHFEQLLCWFEGVHTASRMRCLGSIDVPTLDHRCFASTGHTYAPPEPTSTSTFGQVSLGFLGPFN